MEYIREGVIVKTTKGDFLVVKIDEYDEQGDFYEYLLMTQHGFTSVGWYRNEEEIKSNYEILDVVLATVEQSLPY